MGTNSMNGKGNAPGYEPRARGENSTEGDIFYPDYSISGQAGEIEYTPDQAAAAEYCDLQAQRWHTKAELHRLEMALEAYGEGPGDPGQCRQLATNTEPGELTPKEEKLRHYATRDLMPFLQFDGFYDPGGYDPVMRPDSDGDSLTSGATQELMTGIPNIRILITPTTSQEQALRLLKKIRTWIKKDGLKDIAYFGPKNTDQISNGKIPF